MSVVINFPAAGGGGGSGGGGTVTSVNGQVGPAVVLTASNVGAMATAINWAAGTNTPALTSGTAVLGAVYLNTTPGITTLSPNIDGYTQVNFNDLMIGFSAGTYTLVPAGEILGIFATAGALQTAFPAASNIGSMALVGTGPYTRYTADNGTSWQPFTAGGSGTTIDMYGGNSFSLIPIGVNTTTWTGLGHSAAPAIVGTGTARTGQLASIGYLSRIGYVSAIAVNSSALITTSSTNFQTAAPDTGSFFPPQRMRVVCSMTDALTACRVGVGFMATTPTTTVEPSTVVNTAWFAADSTDTQLTLMTCAGSGTATKTVLNGGTGFPANTNGADVYECYLEFLGGATRTINYYILNRVTGVKATGSVTATLPVAGTQMRVGAYRNTAANVTAASIDVVIISGGGFAQAGLVS